MTEQASDAVDGHAWLPNKYARCECALADFDPEEFPICTHFENVPNEDCEDACKACRHGSDCHLKGHEAQS